jgi:diguanylate cyclase (GGDEF)-like protein
MRSYDSIGRYGGEEFLVVLPGCDDTATVKHAERLRVALSSEPMNLVENRVTLTASFGCTVVAPGMQPTVAEVVRWADEALYRAKGDGRNAVALVNRHPALVGST